MSSITKKNPFAKNAVLFKDMSIDIKRPKVLILMLIFNGVIASIASGFMLYMTVAGLSGERIDYRSLVYMLITLISTEAAVLFTMMPALTANTISGEKERQTLDVLLTTRMTPFEIVMGKYLSCVTLGILLIVSTMPFLALVFIYGGLSLIQLFGLVAVEILEIAYIAAFGVFFSSLTKKTVFAVILSYVILGILVIGTFIGYGIVYGIGELINEAISNYYYQNFSYSGTAIQNIPEFHLDIAIFLLLFNPVVTIFDCIGSFLGVEIDDVTFQGMRTIVDMNYIQKGNILMTLWTPLSLILQGGIVFGLLRLAGVCLNPVKNTKKRERQFERQNMKRVGVQDDPALDAMLLPSTGAAGAAPMMTPDGQPMQAPQMQTPDGAQPMQAPPMQTPDGAQSMQAPQMQTPPVMQEGTPTPMQPVQPGEPQVVQPQAVQPQMTYERPQIAETAPPMAQQAVQEMAPAPFVQAQAATVQTEVQDIMAPAPEQPAVMNTQDV